MRRLACWLLCAAVVPVLSCGYSDRKQEDYCPYTIIKVTCESREQMQQDFKYWAAHGNVISIDDGPRETMLSGMYGCCYAVTYQPDGSG